MDDEPNGGTIPLESEEVEIDTDDESLESVMRDALEAVERSEGKRRVSAKAPDEDDGSVERGEIDVARLQEEIADLRDRSIRTLADFDNFRKRVARERRDELRYASYDVLRESLAVLDNLERAAISKGPVEDLRAGIGLIVKQLEDLFRRFGVQRIEAIGRLFDPEVHEAVSRYEDPEVTVPTVSEELQAGFKIHDRLLRPSVVRVAMPSESPSSRAGEVEVSEADHD